ncbi:MAG TPA: hypothetical protein V6D17_20035 [Candidatus Obscuribacterales bacterium]
MTDDRDAPLQGVPVPENDKELTLIHLQWAKLFCYPRNQVWLVLLLLSMGCLLLIPFGALTALLLGAVAGRVGELFTLVIMLAFLPASIAVFHVLNFGCLRLDHTGIQFPITYSFAIGGTRRNWDEVSRVSVVRGPVCSGYILGNILNFEFQSGKQAGIELWRIPVDELSVLVEALRKFCPDKCDTQTMSQLFNCHLYEIAQPDDYRMQRYSPYLIPVHKTVTSFLPFGKSHPQSELAAHGLTVEKLVSGGGISARYLASKLDYGDCNLRQINLAAFNGAARANLKKALAARAEQFKAMDHPLIARVVDYFFEDDAFFVVCQASSGTDLRSYVNSKKRLRPREALNITRKALEILCYVHSVQPPAVSNDTSAGGFSPGSAGVVVGDLSPDSFIVGAGGDVMLVPITGIACDSTVLNGQVAGKLPFIAPEQVLGVPLRQSDIYALGAVMFFMLVGDEPNPMQKLQPSAAQLSVPRELSELVGRATDPSIDARISSALEFLEALDAVQSRVKG